MYIAYKQKTILVDAVDCFVSDTGEINKDMYEMLEQFDNPKIIVTNAPDEKMSDFGLDKVPYPVFSLKKKPPKTEIEYWNILFDRYSLTSDDVIYFEHSSEAIKSAESVGITSFLYKLKTNNIDEVKEFLNNNIYSKN